MKPERHPWAGKGLTTAPVDSERYAALFPYYLEMCALSELRKKPGIGVPVRSGMGGHCLLYLNGVARDRAAGYPVLRLCPPGAAPHRHGAGISVNAHYRNAQWAAADGPDFLWRGVLAPGEALTREAYERTQHHAKASGLLDGVEFHPQFFRDKPAGMAERDYMYEISVATDYAACFGRDAFRARIPLDAPRMGAVVDYLNGLNAPYRNGSRSYNWRLFTDNCAHVTHNALAAAGLWPHWPTGAFIGRALFRFPVPKNELVDAVHRANDLPIDDAAAIYADIAARRLLLTHGALPTAPGALAIAERAILDNAVYETARLRLIFFDNPFWGAYRGYFARIFGTSRYTDLRANLAHFAARYAAAQARPSARGLAPERMFFQRRYEAHIDAEAAALQRLLVQLDAAPERLEVPVP